MRIYRGRPIAAAKISGGRDTPLLSGRVRFYQMPGGVLVEADISGLPNNADGFYGFHIHTGNGCTGEGFSATGSHYDPTKQPHPRHAGDLPPLMSNGGKAYMAVMTDRFSISDILGRTIVVHRMSDDFRSQPAGNAGEKIACGVIERTT